MNKSAVVIAFCITSIFEPFGDQNIPFLSALLNEIILSACKIKIYLSQIL